jgi:HAD superfamily hydrolase (TIGR01509 family)
VYVKTVIFDLDGTLVDSNEAHAISWVQAYKLVGYGEVPVETVLKYIGIRGDLITEKVLGREALKDYKRIRFYKDKVFLKLLREGYVTLFPEVYDVLKVLKSYGVKLCVATSTSIPLLITMLEYFNIMKYFDVLVAGEEVRRSKPEPDLYLEALKRTETDGREALIVGDSEYDVIPAKAVGATTVLVMRDNQKKELSVNPDYVVKDLIDLVKNVLKLRI